MNIEFYQSLNDELKDRNVKLIVVSKTQPIEALEEAYQMGVRCFGENKVQELVDKYEQLPKDIEWHMIGHLQSNKVKYIAPFVSLIHAVDSLSLLEEINKQAFKNNRVINCLLQCHIATEETKFGFSKEELISMLASEKYKELQNIRVCGLMGMATNTDDVNQVTQEFEGLHNLFKTVKQSYFLNQDSFQEISMGMSGDYKIAIDHGSTMIRIGSSLFGARH